MIRSPHLIQEILANLFVKDAERLTSIKKSLIEENGSLGNPKEGFLYGGMFWTFVTGTNVQKLEKRMIHASLMTAAKDFIFDLEQVKKEQLRIKQGLSVVIKGCTDAQDVRDVVPEFLLPYLPDNIKCLPRHREPGWTVKDNPMKAHQFEVTSEMVGFYVANSLIY